LKSRLTNDEIKYDITSKSIHGKDNKILLVTNWHYILELLHDNLIDNNERQLAADVDQIIGFCEVIDNSTFLPISDSDLSPSFAKRVNSYYDLCDKIVDYLIHRHGMNVDNLRATPQRYGYARWVQNNSYGVSIYLNFKYWEVNGTTPFWFSVRENAKPTWTQSKELHNKLIEIGTKLGLRYYEIDKVIYFALVPCTDAVEEVVVYDIVNSIMKVLGELQ